MTLAAWIIFLTITGGVITFFIYSMYKVINARPVKKVHPVYDVDTDKHG